jgi:alkylation response protein AidB-like acyl-CoA dehydrogenase
VIRHDIAEADAARLLIRRAVIAMEDAAKARQPASPQLRELAARDRHFATLYALRAAERLFKAAGSRALFDGNDLQRCFRDVHAVASRTTRLGAIGRMSVGEV